MRKLGVNMSGILLSTKKIVLPHKCKSLLQQRGPKGTFKDISNNLSYIYTLSTQQYQMDDTQIDRKDTIILLDGTVYSTNNVSSPLAQIEQSFLTYGNMLAHYLDGDYSFCIIDKRSCSIIFSTDVFGTKPLWYALENGELSICSYRSPLEAIGCVNIMRAQPNTTYCFHKPFKKLYTHHIHSFDLTKRKHTYDDWLTAFEYAIEKRTANASGIAFGLSSGHDSGAILCELLKKSCVFSCYSFLGHEDQSILKRRLEMSHSANLMPYNEHTLLLEMRNVLHKCEPYQDSYFDMYKDECTFGMSMMYKKAISEGFNVILSGIGSDEIISDYGFNGHKYSELSEFGGLFPDDLHLLFPWKNIYDGSLRAYVTREEYISGMYGGDVRYPYLDISLVQEFLWLDCSLKNKNYKAPLFEYFTRNSFPFSEHKVGFYLREP